MKYLLIGLGVLVLCAVIFLTAHKAPQTQTISVLVDVTEEFEVTPQADYFKRSFGFQNDLWVGSILRLRTLSEIVYGHVFEHELLSAVQWFSNEGQRTGEINHFFKSIESSIDTINSMQTERIQSSIYKTIVDELMMVTASSATKKMVYVFSDLREHSEVLNTYQSSVLRQLYSKPNEIKEQLQQTATLPNLTGISIYIIYQPTSFETAKPFEAMAGIYKSLFTDQGASVHISHNLQN